MLLSKYFRWGDIIVLIMVSLPLFIFNPASHSIEERRVHIKVRNSDYYYNLSQDTDIVFHLDYDTMVVGIRRGEVYIVETHCPLKLCKKTGRISLPGQNIVCLPNKVFIEITGAYGAKLDGITR